MGPTPIILIPLTPQRSSGLPHCGNRCIRQCGLERTLHPFGLKWTDPAANRDNEGYTGHIEDDASGLTYMQARYYDPALGRFLANDPVGFAEGGPGYFNRYAYTLNNPAISIDPDGEASTRVCRSVLTAGSHCFIVVTDDNTGEVIERFSFGPQRNGRRDPGQLVSVTGSGLDTDDDDRALERNGGGQNQLK
ncbi:MAG: RHS repeat-associated core domain-containing protein [Pseudomonadota bacterium]